MGCRKRSFTKLLFFVGSYIFSIAAAFAQQNTGTIKGTITTNDGKAAANVSVIIKGSKNGTITDDNGAFEFDKIATGNYTLQISLTGYQAIESKINVAENKTLVLALQLKLSNRQLGEIVIIQNNLSEKEGNYVAKMPLKNIENPQVYNTVSSELLKQQGITNYDDAMRNVPGISRTWESTGRAGDGASYFALRGFDAQPTLINGLPGLTNGNLDPASVEEIMVIKGPSATLFGGSFYSYGGMINTITKKPYFNFGGELAYNIGSFGLNRITADFNTPLSKQEKIALRINTAYHSENSFQDAGFKKSFFFAPSLAYEVNDKLSFHFIAEILEEERAVAPVFFNSNRLSPLDFKTINELNLNKNLSFTSNDLTIKNPRFNLQGQMLYKLSDQWNSQTVISTGNVKSNGIYTYIWDDVPGDIYFSQYIHSENQNISTVDIQQNFNGDFKIGKLRNRLLLGLDYFSRNAIDNGSGWAYARNVTPQGDVNYVDPFSGDSLAPVYLTMAAINNLLAGTEPANSNIKNTSYSAYVSNVLNVTPGLMVMLSLRADYFDSKGEKNTPDDEYHQLALSPKLGLIYQPVPDKLSVFANYMNAFINVAPQQVSDPDGSNTRVKSFKPEHADQFEFGVKTNLFSDKFSATVSFYNIKVSDRVSPDPNNMHNSLQGGKVGSKGFELDMNAVLFPGVNLVAGYSYNEAKIIAGDVEDFYAEPGRAPGGQGPQNLANLWANYKFANGKLKNFGFGIGGNYASQYKVIDNSKTGVFNLPGYTLLNASIFHNSKHNRIALNINNITNKEYYIGYWSVNPQKPINFVASFAYKF